MFFKLLFIAALIIPTGTWASAVAGDLHHHGHNPDELKQTSGGVTVSIVLDPAKPQEKSNALLAVEFRDANNGEMVRPRAVKAQWGVQWKSHSTRNATLLWQRRKQQYQAKLRLDAGGGHRLEIIAEHRGKRIHVVFPLEVRGRTVTPGAHKKKNSSGGHGGGGGHAH